MSGLESLLDAARQLEELEKAGEAPKWQKATSSCPPPLIALSNYYLNRTAPAHSVNHRSSLDGFHVESSFEDQSCLALTVGNYSANKNPQIPSFYLSRTAPVHGADTRSFEEDLRNAPDMALQAFSDQPEYVPLPPPTAANPRINLDYEHYSYSSAIARQGTTSMTSSHPLIAASDFDSNMKAPAYRSSVDEDQSCSTFSIRKEPNCSKISYPQVAPVYLVLRDAPHTSRTKQAHEDHSSAVVARQGATSVTCTNIHLNRTAPVHDVNHRSSLSSYRNFGKSSQPLTVNQARSWRNRSCPLNSTVDFDRSNRLNRTAPPSQPGYMTHSNPRQTSNCKENIWRKPSVPRFSNGTPVEARYPAHAIPMATSAAATMIDQRKHNTTSNTTLTTSAARMFSKRQKFLESSGTMYPSHEEKLDSSASMDVSANNITEDHEMTFTNVVTSTPRSKALPKINSRLEFTTLSTQSLNCLSTTKPMYRDKTVKCVSQSTPSALDLEKTQETPINIETKASESHFDDTESDPDWCPAYDAEGDKDQTEDNRYEVDLNDLSIFEYIEKYQTIDSGSESDSDEENAIGNVPPNLTERPQEDIEYHSSQFSKHAVEGQSFTPGSNITIHAIDDIAKETLEPKVSKAKKRLLNKRRKEKGLKYTGLNGIVKRARRIGPPCDCRMKCKSKYPDTIRAKILKAFLSLKSAGQTTMLLDHLRITETATTKVTFMRLWVIGSSNNLPVALHPS